MALSTSTSTLAAGASRTFNLSPGSALTLVAPPNVRATVTETPNTVSASGVGGNASRVHNLQLGQTVTYGPYPMGGTVVVANASDSGTAITWVRSDALVAESASGVVSLVSGDGNLYALAQTFTWATLPAAADYIGPAHVSDVGVHGSLWRSDGSTWGIVGGSAVLAVNNVAGTTLTGTASETELYSLTIKGGLLGLNGALEVIGKYTMTNSGNIKTFRTRMGGLAGTVVNDPQFTTSATIHMTTRIENRNSQSSQIGSNGTANITSSTNSWRTASVNTSSDWSLSLSGQLASTGESITLEQVRVVLVRP